MAYNGLGTDYDLSIGVSPVDLATAGGTGKRINMSLVKSVDVVFIKGAGTAADDPTVTLRAHTAATSGTSADLAVVETYYRKQEATLDGDEAWTEVTQAAAATVVGNATSAEEEQIIVIPVDASSMPSDKKYLSLDVTDTGTPAQLGAVLYIIHHHDKKRPADLRIPLR